MRVFGFYVLLLLSFGQPVYAQLQPESQDTVAERYQLPGADCALFPAAASFPPTHIGDEYKTGMKRFTPTQAQLATTEQALLTINFSQISYRYEPTDYYANYPQLIKNQLSNYKRQYYGFYNGQNHPCLFINFFTEYAEEIHGQPMYWLYYPVHVFDGGWGFWSVYYDLTTNKFFLYEHNGEG